MWYHGNGFVKTITNYFLPFSNIFSPFTITPLCAQYNAHDAKKKPNNKTFVHVRVITNSPIKQINSCVYNISMDIIKMKQKELQTNGKKTIIQ